MTILPIRQEPVRLHFPIEMPPQVEALRWLLSDDDSSVLVYAVGGCIRDAIYAEKEGDEYEPKDVDLTTNLSEEEIIRRLTTPEAIAEGVRVHEKESVDTFGVVFVHLDGQDFEIAPFRKDVGCADGRRPDSVERATIWEDALRRDLTMNNLYYDLEMDEILDFNFPSGGIEDILWGRVRFVGKAWERCEEDKLRVLRFVRFYARFRPKPDLVDRCDDDTGHALRHFGGNLLSYPGMSGERVQAEFAAGVKQSRNTQHYLQMLYDLNLFSQILPGVEIRPETFERIGKRKEIHFVLAVLLLESDNIYRRLIDAKWSGDDASLVDLLVAFHRCEYSDVVDVVKSKMKRINVSKRELTDEEEMHNREERTRIGKAIAPLAMTEKSPDRRLFMCMLNCYEPKNLPDGETLMAQGLKGKEIGEAQRRAIQEQFNELMTEQFTSIAGYVPQGVS